MSHQPLVMIVEDDHDTRQMYATGLALAGCRTLQATNALDALSAAREALPDVVITDVGLRGPMTGIELTRELRSDESTKRVGIIVVTGWSGTAVVGEAKRAGCDAMMTKPCLPDDLAVQVLRVLASRAMSPSTAGESHQRGSREARCHAAWKAGYEVIW